MKKDVSGTLKLVVAVVFGVGGFFFGKTAIDSLMPKGPTFEDQVEKVKREEEERKLRPQPKQTFDPAGDKFRQERGLR